MTRLLFALAACSLAAALCLPARSQTKGGKVVPKLEPVAETRLLMEGLAHANFRGLERHLSAKPADEQTWVFARGQALLVAETANLLMLRPPKKEGQETWFLRSMELRARAASLARAVAAKDLDLSRKALVELGAACTRCHQNFGIPQLIEPFAEGPKL